MRLRAQRGAVLRPAARRQTGGRAPRRTRPHGGPSQGARRLLGADGPATTRADPAAPGWAGRRADGRRGTGRLLAQHAVDDVDPGVRDVVVGAHRRGAASEPRHGALGRDGELVAGERGHAVDVTQVGEREASVDDVGFEESAKLALARQ